VLSVCAAICLIAIVTIACARIDTATGTDGQKPGSAGTATISGKDVTELLGQLAVAPEASMTGYSREKFPHWDLNKPEHGFGAEFAQYSRCTSRDVMLLRDATGSVKLDPKTCEFSIGPDGGWRDQYGFLDQKTGELKPYKWMTDPATVDAEHIVALAEAWRSGAGTRDEDTRRRIANDTVNLAASDPSANRSKGDQDVANYLPPGNFRCGYLGRYIQVKVKYALTVDRDEQAALRTTVDDCVRRGGFR
jgi:hypothetical protein